MMALLMDEKIGFNLSFKWKLKNKLVLRWVKAKVSVVKDEQFIKQAAVFTEKDKQRLMDLLGIC